MTPERLAEWIAAGESLDVEFKGEERGFLSDDDSLEELVLFANKPLQHEQMVLQFLEKYGRITRAEASNLCRLAPNQAYRLLKSLENKGLLRAVGKKKGRYYECRA